MEVAPPRVRSRGVETVARAISRVTKWVSAGVEMISGGGES